MKMRSKTMSLLAVAAALVLLVGVAALAAGRLGAPRPDNVTLGQPTSRTTPTAEPTVYCTPQGKYYHRDENCSGMQAASATTPSEAQARGKQPCPVCMDGQNEPAIDDELSNLTAKSEVSEFLVVPTEEDSATVYYTREGSCHHSVSDCSGMQNAQTTTERKAQAMGKFRCQVCNAAEPEFYDVFLNTFGQPLSAIFPGFQYERSVETEEGFSFAGEDWYVSNGEQEQLACKLTFDADGGMRTVSSFHVEFSSASIANAFLDAAPNPIKAAWNLYKSECEDAVTSLEVVLFRDGTSPRGTLNNQNSFYSWKTDSTGKVSIAKGSPS